MFAKFKNNMFGLLALLLAFNLTLGSFMPATSASSDEPTEPANSTTVTAQDPIQSTETSSAAHNQDNPSFNSWDDLMKQMDNVPLPLASYDEVIIYKLFYYLDDHFVDGEKVQMSMQLEGDKIVNPGQLMLAITRVVRCFNDDPSHQWFVEWDPIYKDNGDITIHVYISKDRQKYPVTQMGLSKILPDARFYTSAWGFGSGLYDTFSADEWFYNENCFVIVLGVAHLDKDGRVIQTDFIPANSDPICPVTPIDTSGPGHQRYLLIGTIVNHEIVVLGFTNSGNVRSVRNVNS